MQPWVYIVLLGVAAILYAFILPARVRDGNADKQSLKETEAALELYMADIERENDELVQLVSSIKQQSQSNQLVMQEQISDLREQLIDLKNSSSLLEARLAEDEKNLQQLSHAYEMSATAAAAAAGVKPQRVESGVEQPEEKQKPISSIKLRYPRLFELHEQGKSIDSIAKTAGLQRGEVQLILQLAKQEASL